MPLLNSTMLISLKWADIHEVITWLPFSLFLYLACCCFKWSASGFCCWCLAFLRYDSVLFLFYFIDCTFLICVHSLDFSLQHLRTARTHTHTIYLALCSMSYFAIFLQLKALPILKLLSYISLPLNLNKVRHVLWSSIYVFLLEY